MATRSLGMPNQPNNERFRFFSNSLSFFARVCVYFVASLSECMLAALFDLDF